MAIIVKYYGDNKVSNNEPILNLSTINELKDILEDEIISIYQEFQTSASEMIKELKESQIKGDIDSIAHISHTIKGSSGNLGLQGIYLLSQELELSVKDSQSENISTLINKLEDIFYITVSELVKAGLLPE